MLQQCTENILLNLWNNNKQTGECIYNFMVQHSRNILIYPEKALTHHYTKRAQGTEVVVTMSTQMIFSSSSFFVCGYLPYPRINSSECYSSGLYAIFYIFHLRFLLFCFKTISDDCQEKLFFLIFFSVVITMCDVRVVC